MPYAFLANPALDRRRPYDARLAAIQSHAAATAAVGAITAWAGYAPTPLVSLDRLAAAARVGAVTYKHEGHRFGLASFKALGGAYAVERLVAERGGAAGLTVTCATDGNHGRSVAWGAKRLGVRAVIYVHESVSEGRAAAIAGFGAEVRRAGANYDASVRASAEAAARHGWTIVSDTSWPGYETIPKDVMQGYAVMVMETARQAPRPTHVFVQGGVGGVAAAVLAWLWERDGAARPRFVVVEPDKAACLFESARAGRLTAVGGDLDTIMAGLACGEPSRLAWDVLSPGVDAFATIADDEAATMMRTLAGMGIAAGESGVAGLAGFMRVAADPAARAAIGLDASSRVLCFGTEGATDPDVYRAIVGRDARDVEPVSA